MCRRHYKMEWRQGCGYSGPPPHPPHNNQPPGGPHGHEVELLEKLLREEMGYEGVLVTDYNKINNLVSWNKVFLMLARE